MNGVRHFRVGDIACAVVSDGRATWPAWPTYACNAEKQDVAAALAQRGLDPENYTLDFGALLLRLANGSLVLVDTGAGAELGPGLGLLPERLRGLGVDPEIIGTVVITHCHPDHIGGLVAPDGALTYPNAVVKMAEAEWQFWSDESGPDLSRLAIPDGFKDVFKAAASRHLGPIRDRLEIFRPGQDIVAGLHAIAAPGHTPGHVALRISSGAEQLLHAGDVFHHPAFDLEHPSWATAFDADSVQAHETRSRLLDQAAAEGALLTAYHMPDGETGHVHRRGDGYHWEAVS